MFSRGRNRLTWSFFGNEDGHEICVEILLILSGVLIGEAHAKTDCPPSVMSAVIMARDLRQNNIYIFRTVPGPARGNLLAKKAAQNYFPSSRILRC